MANAVTYQCPNCNGLLAYDAQTGMLACAHCGISFSEGEVERAIPLGGAGDEGTDADARQIEHVTTVKGFLEHAPWEADGANVANAVGYSCPSCGANVIADRSAVTATCPYCGNNMLVSGIATAETIPQKVIPFSVTHDEAVMRMHEHFRHKWYLSRKFSAELEHLQGVYVPYHLYGLRVSGWADYIGVHEMPAGKGGKIDTGHIALHRAGYVDISNLPVDGSSKMPDAHMDAIAPFDFDKMRDFSTSYVAGYLAEVADESAEACLPRADERARDPFVEQLAVDAGKVENVDSLETVKSHTDVDVVNVTTCLLPVWLMHCTWADEQMLFAMNGDTGKCVGNLPIDKVRRAVTLIACIIIDILFVAPLVKELVTNSDMPGFMWLLVIVILMIPFGIDALLKDQMNTAVEAHGDGLDYSSEGLVITESWDGPKFHLKRDKALADFKER